MTQFKGTPGPWAYRKHNLSIYAVPPKSNRAVPQIKKWIGRVNQTDDWHANARLIASAPALLEALKEAANSLKFAHEELRGSVPDADEQLLLERYEKARAAIRQATGEEA